MRSHLKRNTMDFNELKRFRRSGGYRRKLENSLQTVDNVSRSCFNSGATSLIADIQREGSASSSFLPLARENEAQDEHDEDNDSESDNENEYEKNQELRQSIQCWAVKFNIPNMAVNELCTIINQRIPDVLPKDARTLLMTNKESLHIKDSAPGKYWHNGLIKCLKNTFKSQDVNNVASISLNINVDGLPVYNSSRHQLWPILCNITELPQCPPFVIGIYAGEGKPGNLSEYLEDFVIEMNELEANGLNVGSTEGPISVRIRAFICDSPARALIKGVTNFNGKHGCLKCTVVGEYSHRSNTVTFPKFDCPRRNDDDFRAKKYDDHHKQDSPLLNLHINMVEDFPVADSLHLIDLGLMKRLLTGWRDGKLGKYLTKWCSRDIETVNNFLLMCKLPKEIHRSVRSIHVLAHWKGSEYRSFFYYLSLIILKFVLKPEPFVHFLHLFCAITICSNEKYFALLPIAEKLLIDFAENFIKFYGRDYVTSNIHNLIHVVDDVKRFGILQRFNAYPFENKLYAIKRSIRQGNNTLQQVARRLLERERIEIKNHKKDKVQHPFVKKSLGNGTLELHLESFMLSTKKENKWFLTTENYVVELQSVNLKGGNDHEIEIEGHHIKTVYDAFDKPMKSSFLNIYKCSCTNIQKSVIACKVENIKCKLVCVVYKSEMFFVPLLHTLQ